MQKLQVEKNHPIDWKLNQSIFTQKILFFYIIHISKTLRILRKPLIKPKATNQLRAGLAALRKLYIGGLRLMHKNAGWKEFFNSPEFGIIRIVLFNKRAAV